MNLTVGERIALLQLLPKEGNFVTLKIVRDLQGALSFSESEIEEYSIVENGGHVRWNTDADEGADVEVGEKALDIITTALRQADEEERLTQATFELYERFVANE